MRTNFYTNEDVLTSLGSLVKWVVLIHGARIFFFFFLIGKQHKGYIRKRDKPRVYREYTKVPKSQAKKKKKRQRKTISAPIHNPKNSKNQ